MSARCSQSSCKQEKKQSCLVKGPVYGQQARLNHGGAGSELEVRGADSSIAMDRENVAALWSNTTDSDSVGTLVQRHGFTAETEPTPARHEEAKHPLVQRESDLAFIRRLARRNGFLFWLTAEVSGAETAHFKRPPLDEEPTVELIINLSEPAANIDFLEICWDAERPTSARAAQLDLNTKDDLDGSAARSPLPRSAPNRWRRLPPAHAPRTWRCRWTIRRICAGGPRAY